MPTKRVIDTSSLRPSLQDLMDHLRLTDHSQDRMLMGYLQSAVLQAEHTISRTLASSDVTYTGPVGPAVRLPFVDSTVITELTSVTVDGEEVAYSLDFDLLILPDGTTGKTLSVVYRVAASEPEQDICQAILLMAARHFNNPLDSVDSLPSASANLLAPYRRYGIGR